MEYEIEQRGIIMRLATLNKENCWHFELYDKDNYGYLIPSNDYVKKMELVFNGIHYVIFLYRDEYEGLLYINEDIEKDDVYNNIPFPVYLTWDGWTEYRNDYYKKAFPCFESLFREQPFLSEEEMLDYINVQLPKIFKHIEDNNF